MAGVSGVGSAAGVAGVSSGVAGVVSSSDILLSVSPKNGVNYLNIITLFKVAWVVVRSLDQLCAQLRIRQARDQVQLTRNVSS